MCRPSGGARAVAGRGLRLTRRLHAEHHPRRGRGRRRVPDPARPHRRRLVVRRRGDDRRPWRRVGRRRPRRRHRRQHAGRSWRRRRPHRRTGGRTKTGADDRGGQRQRDQRVGGADVDGPARPTATARSPSRPTRTGDPLPTSVIYYAADDPAAQAVAPLDRHPLRRRADGRDPGAAAGRRSPTWPTATVLVMLGQDAAGKTLAELAGGGAATGAGTGTATTVAGGGVAPPAIITTTTGG